MALETLSEDVRKVRRSLLAASLIGYAISKIDVTITKATVFGTEFKFGNFDAIPFVLALIILYFFIAFIIFALSEYASLYRGERREYIRRIMNSEDVPLSALQADEKLEQLETAIEKAQFEDQRLSLKKEIDNIWKCKKYFEGEKKSVFHRFSFMKLRYIIEFFIPIFVSVYAMILLFFLTDFKYEQATVDKSEVTIKTEQVIIQQQTRSIPVEPTQKGKKDLKKN
jgi:hypothetical protein